MTSKKKAAPAAPAAAQPAPAEPATRLPFGEGESPAGGGSSSVTGTAPQLGNLVEETEVTFGDGQPEPDSTPFDERFNIPSIPLEEVPHLTIIGPGGIFYYLDPWRPQGMYMLRQKPGVSGG